jgi:hypothetical protein
MSMKYSYAQSRLKLDFNKYIVDGGFLTDVVCLVGSLQLITSVSKITPAQNNKQSNVDVANMVW